MPRPGLIRRVRFPALAWIESHQCLWILYNKCIFRHRCHSSASIKYISCRAESQGIPLKRYKYWQLSPERSLDTVRHSPSGFEVGYRGSGPAQLACGLIFDYCDDTQVAREHYIAFRNCTISQLECDSLAACWHLSGEEIDAAMSTISDDIVALPDGGQPSPHAPRELANGYPPRPASLRAR